MIMKISNFYKELKYNITITIVNVFGYSIALSACLIIGLFVYHQFTFDRFNARSERIFRLNYIQNQKSTDNATTNHNWFNVLPKEVPGIEKAARFGWAWDQNIEFDKKSYKAKGASGDIELFDIFSFRVLQQESENFFEKPLSIALSKSLANKIFGAVSPVGKTLTLNYGQKYTVSAVFDDIPSNSSLQFEFLTSTNDALDEFGEEMKNHWLWWTWRTFVLVEDKTMVAGFGNIMKPLQAKYVGNWYAETSDYYLQPLEKIHLHSSSILGSFDSDISIILIYIFCSSGILILIISCINYINLSTAGFEARKKSVAVKKIIGASRKYLFREYMSFSVLLTFLCILAAFIISLYAIPLLKSQGIIGIDIPLSKPFFWMIIVLFGLIIGVLSGLYPANYISRTVAISTSKALKSKSLFRNGLITVQFSIAIVLLIAAITIKKQLNESTKGELGYDYSSLICFSGTKATFDHFDAMNNEIKKIPGVVATTSCAFPLPGYLGNYWPVQPEGTDVKIEIFHSQVASNFFDVLKIPVKNQLGEFTEDTTSIYDRAVINDKAFIQFGIGESILGKSYNLGETKVQIVGIVSDFHIGSMHDPIKPIQFTIADKCWNFIIRLQKTGFENNIAEIRHVWEKFETVEPFEYQFVGDLIIQQYRNEKSLLKLFNLFFALAMLISLIGLFGLVQLLLRFRIKEIGIRKVNGARTFEIMAMLNKDFIKWVAFAFVIACPIAWYAMHRWLQNFAYKTELSWWVFVVAGTLAVAVAVITVSVQSYRAATRNPVEALRYE